MTQYLLSVHDTGVDERRGVGLVQPHQLLEILVDDDIAVVVAATGEVRHPADPLHQDGVDAPRRFDVAEEMWHREAAFLHQRVERELVAQRKGLRICAVAAQHERHQLAVAIDIDEPGRPPPLLAADVDHAPADVLLDDLRGARRRRDAAHVGFGSRGRPRARSPSRFCMIWLLPPEMVYAFA